jgi:hypothetical protein
MVCLEDDVFGGHGGLVEDEVDGLHVLDLVLKDLWPPKA